MNQPYDLKSFSETTLAESLANDYTFPSEVKNKYHFLEAFNNFDAFGTPYSYLESTEGFSIGYDEPDRYYRASIPATTVNDNIEREEYLIAFGFRIIRFTNEEITRNLEAVLQKIVEVCEK